ncbi:hypothetical protein O9G_000529 [Rozella allomycis CSF55]|uniref:GSKIP domain-containing protein n=1 Tax=Rozella allomycis (strain CSF55) TaxID=988480 RepID=A0A075AW12_ROZAC|nr:hypothetical protein O9G_000529 [Rozella allomycis CSF55]|eukprot:EPZ34342.1 hypothetical protein O9G_000529 [Rozella allomycis CSF55]
MLDLKQELTVLLKEYEGFILCHRFFSYDRSEIKFSITTIDSKTVNISFSQKGFLLREQHGADGMLFENFEALLNNVSPQFKFYFSNLLIKKLESDIN